MIISKDQAIGSDYDNKFRSVVSASRLPHFVKECANPIYTATESGKNNCGLF